MTLNLIWYWLGEAWRRTDGMTLTVLVVLWLLTEVFSLSRLYFLCLFAAGFCWLHSTVSSIHEMIGNVYADTWRLQVINQKLDRLQSDVSDFKYRSR